MSIPTSSALPSFHLAIVGAGPRGTSTIERLASLVRTTKKLNTTLVVSVFDSYRPGSGHVWDSSQSSNFWMNTPASFPTVAPDRIGDEPGLSFAQFVQLSGDGASLSEQQLLELNRINSGSFPSRALYGRYLEHVYDRCVQVLSEHPNVHYTFHSAQVQAVRPDATGYLLSYRPVAGDAAEQLKVDAVVLALGHQESELNPHQRVLAEQAEQAAASYIPPSIPLDVDYGKFRPGAPALLRGMGLNFFDAMAELTLGRGGVFREVSKEPGRRFKYEPCGQEPELVVASRRGTPYWGKPVSDTFIDTAIELTYLEPEQLLQQVAEARTDNPSAALNFNRDIWPQLHRDVLWAYYQQCASDYAEQLPISSEEFIERVAQILDAEHHEGVQVWLATLRDFIGRFPMMRWLDVPALAHPFAEIGFGSHEQYQQAVREYLVHNAQSSSRGVTDPLGRAIMTMNAGRMVVKDLITRGLVEQQSRIEEIQGRFEPLVEGLSSGPPLERIEQLLALSRAGIVNFIGPEPVFEFDALAGKFQASSPWVDTEPYTARVLCEAMMPANRVLQNNTALIRQLLTEHVAREFRWRNIDGEQIPGSGFDVVGEPYRLVDSQGLAHRGIFVLGLQLSSVQWGTAIAAQAGEVDSPSARTLFDAQIIINEVARLSGLELSPLALLRAQQGVTPRSAPGAE